MNIVIFGPQGSGKGTQAELLTKRMNLFHFEMGALIREEARKNSPMGKKIDQIANIQGKLLPDQITNSLVEKKMTADNLKKGVVFDGYPRNITQFNSLEKYLKTRGEKIDRAFFLILSEKESLRRLSARRVCANCGENFNLITNPPEQDGVCDSCGKKLIQRIDDTLPRIRARLQEYRKQTTPLVSLLRQRGILEEVDGERPIEIIFKDIFSRLEGK